MASSTTSWSSDLFGQKILKKPKTSGVPTSTQFKGKKIVAIYFSASWCPPCRTFSPLLKEFYNTCKDDVEVVFVSSDKDESSFSDYYGKMPWLSMVPGFTSAVHSDKQAKLANMFKIQGIPSVIVLDAKTGKFISDNGRAEIMQATNDESKKALVQSWLSKEAVSVEQAVLGQGGGADNLLVKVLKYIIQRPAYMVACFYFIKRFLKILEEIGMDEENKEL